MQLHVSVYKMLAHQRNAAKSAQVINYRCGPNDLGVMFYQQAVKGELHIVITASKSM